MMLTEVKGLVIRTADLSESDRIITIFTDTLGVISAYANNSRSLKSRYMAAAQIFCYGSYMLYKRGDRFWVREVDLIESFFGLRSSIVKTALAAYFCELLCDVETNEADLPTLRLMLNALYAIEHDLAPLDRIKSAFELRLASQIGFMPDLGGCSECGRQDGVMYMDVMDGVALCAECREYAATERREEDILYTGEEHQRVILILTEGVADAMRYVIRTPIERVFSFRLKDEDAFSLYRATEQYLLNHLERGFDTLNFYKEVSK